MAQVWISRPLPRGQALADTLLREYGIHALLRPAMRIVVPPDRQPLEAYLEQITTFTVSIFTTADAANQIKFVLPNTLSSLSAMAIGQQTAAQLPDSYCLLERPANNGDSRTLLESEYLQNTATVAVLGGCSDDGQSPSPLLCQTLMKRGSHVLPVPCYRRQAMPVDWPLSQLGISGQISMATAYSIDSLRYMLLMTAPDNDWLRQIPLIVIHHNIRQVAIDNGFRQVIVASPDQMAITIANTLRKDKIFT